MLAGIVCSFYENSDEFGYDKGRMGWSNLATTVRWNHIFGARLFSNVLVGYTDYSLVTGNEYQYNLSSDGKNKYTDSYESGIRDLHARMDMEFIPNAAHNIRFGVSALQHYFLTGAYEEILRVGETLSDSTASPNRRLRGSEFQIYLEDDWRLSPQARLNIGLHTSGFRVKGKTYTSIEPRIAALLRMGANTSLKASMAYMQQYIHLLATTSGLSLPTDLWVPATPKVRPQKSWQIAGGAVHLLSDGKFEISLEGYYKRMNHLIEYEEGADYFDATYGEWEDRVVSGRGVAYGGEIFFQKKLGRTTGWIGYTLSWSRRKFDEINGGRWFPYRYDRRHDISLVVSHKLRPSLDFSASWVYGTGQAVTMPVWQILAEWREFTAFPWSRNRERELYSVQSSRNGARMPAYHRLDVGMRIHRTRTWGRRILSLGVYNLYNRKNAMSIHATHKRDSDDLVFKKFSLLPIIPSISYQVFF